MARSQRGVQAIINRYNTVSNEHGLNKLRKGEGIWLSSEWYYN